MRYATYFFWWEVGENHGMNESFWNYTHIHDDKAQKIAMRQENIFYIYNMLFDLIKCEEHV